VAFQNALHLLFVVSAIEEDNFSSTFTCKSNAVVIFHKSKENPNPQDTILA